MNKIYLISLSLLAIIFLTNCITIQTPQPITAPITTPTSSPYLYKMYWNEMVRLSIDFIEINDKILEITQEQDYYIHYSNMKHIRDEVDSLEIPPLFSTAKRLEMSWMDAQLEVYDMIEKEEAWNSIEFMHNMSMDYFSRFRAEMEKYEYYADL